MDFCAAQGIKVVKTYKEVASGMNDERREFWKMVESRPTRVVVENRDRLTRFGFNFISRMGGFEVVVMNDGADDNDLMRDLVSVMTSFCCRLYGMRRGAGKVRRMRRELDGEKDKGRIG